MSEQGQVRGDGNRSAVRRKSGGLVKPWMQSVGLTAPACRALTRSRDVTVRVRTTGTQDGRDWTRDLSKTHLAPAFLDQNSSPMLYSVATNLGICQDWGGASLCPQT